MRRLLYLLPLATMILTGCMGDDKVEKQYAEWKTRNDQYIVEFEKATASGSNGYTKIVPEWGPQNSVFIKWHNDRSLTERNLKPLSTSTVNITYAMEDIDGKSLGDSFSLTTWGDSIYQSQPNQNIVGMWAAMLEMHVGDSVTMVIPYTSGYGAQSRGGISPYSNLIYHVKMKDIPKFER
ncbi:MAG: FKBP-type peptidyl-prolyl cis-trans isomerase [Muribaculaceae bacterium]|nr:FKBP-type peptidyl-prolyl cis-trans isomerase [Muribaculaceae bacterium]MDE6836321.1 FKBP-type peptidyl-prolyl cis-trans isomerase [Muribaculaceae bacterium]MDE6866212.1 FKBP-type peptidyl-prolyl cis-trans isomerase [Muribaculaceae bacterium]